MAEPVDVVRLRNATTASVTHFIWVDRWIEAVATDNGWRFKTGKDAAAWLLA